MSRAHRVARDLERRVLDGTYPPGSQLPTEPDLCAEFGVSRTTVRAAVGTLQDRGLLSREQGRGTFVRSADHVDLTMFLDANLSMTAVIRAAGHDPGTTGVTVADEVPPTAVADALGLPHGATCRVLRRIRTADGVPSFESADHLVPHPGLPVEASAYTGSVYELLRETYGRPVATGIARVEAVVPAPGTSARLGIADGAPVLRLSQVHTLDDGRPVMYSVIHLRSDVVHLYVERGLDAFPPDPTGLAPAPEPALAPHS
ncbi:GntR family transcriptional regulator [Actinotalea ferrariae CF5-4]|uniref:GntR family transcriptional regulator n=1 Tax=Actinotalea ferrariae CF5-4 TaxID=948458 RepID=A0A021VRU9_9CELL|nr:GntR family transcriptional regulator [Actinotalea ferrariae]EYR63851.1 GntR family transcriptional regulator [Actinotalea ferrariae CF5-4]